MHTEISLVPWIAAFAASIAWALVIRWCWLRSQRFDRFDINSAIAARRISIMSTFTGTHLPRDVIDNQKRQMQGDGLSKYLESLK